MLPSSIRLKCIKNMINEKGICIVLFSMQTRGTGFRLSSAARLCLKKITLVWEIIATSLLRLFSNENLDTVIK